MLSRPYGHRSKITALALSPSGTHLATGDWGHGESGTAQVWEVATGRCVNVLEWIDGGVGWTSRYGPGPPSGDRGAVLTAAGDIEVWSLGVGEPRRLRTPAAPAGTGGVLWGADDIVVAVGRTVLRFLRAPTGETVGDYTFLREAGTEPPLHGDHVHGDFDGRILALDEYTWCLPVEPDMAIAQPERRADVEAHLAWIVDRRFAWPLHWGRFDIWPDARTAVANLRTTSPGAGKLRRAVRESAG